MPAPMIHFRCLKNTIGELQRAPVTLYITAMMTPRLRYLEGLITLEAQRLRGSEALDLGVSCWQSPW
ncbi:hypothetical protein EYF80_011531 [Liparis tanakae]|uniref:Uncharacterized protein n=1 Tax=Liparis tanakae TaxID=230148 RepID=A0A4Z2IKI1_9TELE|nr:hypothetical protein EYF80_011531 [Liparis tanakae]